MNKDIRFGIEIQKLKEDYRFKAIVDFITGKKEDCYCFDEMKRLYDEFGYKEVNDILIEIANEVEKKYE